MQFYIYHMYVYHMLNIHTCILIMNSLLYKFFFSRYHYWRPSLRFSNLTVGMIKIQGLHHLFPTHNRTTWALWIVQARAFHQSSIHHWDRSVSIGYEALHASALAGSEVAILIDSSFIRDTFIVPSLHMFFFCTCTFTFTYIFTICWTYN